MKIKIIAGVFFVAIITSFLFANNKSEDCCVKQAACCEKQEACCK